MAKTKFYVVWNGRKKGIFNNWDDCKAQIQGYEKAQYKSYPSLLEAELAFSKPFPKNQIKNIRKKEITKTLNENAIAVDAACSGVSGDMEYQGVYVKNKKLLFKKGVFKDGTNNVGEFLALVHALALSQKKDKFPPIYSDSKTAISWVKKGKTKTTLKKTDRNAELFILIERAEKWLSENPIKNEILKWETKQWGENPADFGRK